MNFIFLTLFEDIMKPYFSDSILKRAVDKKIINLSFFNPRFYSTNKHKKVDDYMIAGGAGLLIQAQPLNDAILDIKSKFESTKFIYLTPSGKKFNQNDAKRLSEEKNICFICGRYEGIDERIVEKYVNEVFCIGNFILTGGELPALCLADAISRNIEGVLGNKDSLIEESFNDKLLEAPSFSKPNTFHNISVPSDFLKGNHSKIYIRKNTMAYAKTRFFRPDMVQD